MAKWKLILCILFQFSTGLHHSVYKKKKNQSFLVRGKVDQTFMCLRRKEGTRRTLVKLKIIFKTDKLQNYELIFLQTNRSIFCSDCALKRCIVRCVPLSLWSGAPPVSQSEHGKESIGTSHQAAGPQSHQCSLTEWPD